MKLWARENARNERNEALFRAMIQMTYPDVDLVVGGHHIFYRRGAGSQAEEIPSADALIFDHVIAKAVWGEDDWLLRLSDFAGEPAETRDALVTDMFNQRHRTAY